MYLQFVANNKTKQYDMILYKKSGKSSEAAAALLVAKLRTTKTTVFVAALLQWLGM